MATRRVEDYSQRTHPTSDRSASLHELWESRTRVVLSPIAAPSILGLFGFATATLMVAANLAGWWGTPKSLVYVAPFALTFGGIAQLLAGMWAYKARDALATAMHGMWGAFWIGWSLLEIFMGSHLIPIVSGTYFPALGFWFIMLGLITAIGAAASVPRGAGMFGTLGFLAAGSCLLAASLLSGSLAVRQAGGWVLVFSAGFAVYTAAALLLAEASGGRTVLPLGKLGRDANVPGGRIMRPIEYSEGMPGVRIGQ